MIERGWVINRADCNVNIFLGNELNIKCSVINRADCNVNLLVSLSAL